MQGESSSRRTFLKSALATAAVSSSRLAASRDGASIPTIQLGQHKVTRLILGSNPFNGFSYGIPSLDLHRREWCTPERIAGVVRSSEQNGINTWQFSYYESSMSGLKLHRAAGGQIQWILLTGGAMRENAGLVPEVARLKPIAIVHHGGVTDERFRAGQMDRVREYLKVIRDNGCSGRFVDTPASGRRVCRRTRLGRGFLHDLLLSDRTPRRGNPEAARGPAVGTGLSRERSATDVPGHRPDQKGLPRVQDPRGRASRYKPRAAGKGVPFCFRQHKTAGWGDRGDVSAIQGRGA